MGFSVVAEESVVEAKVQGLLKTSKWDVGVVVGQVSAKKFHVVSLISTPELKRDGDPEKGVAGVDESFFGNHADAIKRHLIGGLHVLGIFIFAPARVETMTKGKRLLSQACAGSKDAWGAFGPSDLENKMYLIINIDASSRKISCKTLNIDDYKANLCPASWSTQSFLSSWHTLKANYTTKFSLPIKIDDKSDESCADWVCRASAIGSKQVVRSIKSLLVLIDGVVANDAAQPLEAKGKKSKTSEHTVELFLPPSTSPITTATDSTASHEIFLSGTISSLVVMSPKASFQEGAREIQADMLRSLRARLHTLREELEESTQTAAATAAHMLQLPSRVLVTVANNLHFCDYMLPVDTMEDVILNLQELFGWEGLTQHQLRNLEQFAPTQSIPDSSTQKPESEASSGMAVPAMQGNSNGNLTMMLGALLVVLVGLLWAMIAS